MATENDDMLVERLAPKILASIRAKSKPVESLSVKADLEGITSLPCYDTTGGQYRNVLVAIAALRQPATEAAEGAVSATSAANEAAASANAAAASVQDAIDRSEEQQTYVAGQETARQEAESARVSAEGLRAEVFTRLKAESETATASANDTADHPTYVGEDNYVYRWDKDAQAYDRTDVYVRGEAFSIKKVYPSVDAMLADTSTAFKEGDFCLIDTGDVENPDNAKLYVRSAAGSWDFLVDMSGAIGFTGKTPQILVGQVNVGSGRDSVSVTLTEDGVDADGNPKYRYNFVIPCLAYKDLTEEQIADLKKPATDAREQVLATEAEIKAEEEIRKANELARESGEDMRQEAEAARENGEEERSVAETARAEAEAGRQAAEAERVSSESGRMEAEDGRVANENIRVAGERAREASEQERQEAESSRQETQEEMIALNEELAQHPPKIDGQGYWQVWDSAGKAYMDTGVMARGRTPVLRDGMWWVWDDTVNDYVNTQESSSGYTLTKEEVESVLTGDVRSHTHTSLIYSARKYDEVPDFSSLTEWEDEDGGVHDFVPGNDIYVADGDEPTGYANYRLAYTSGGKAWVRIPQVPEGYDMVLIRKN